MPRAPGQVDAAKTEAILEAAALLFAERGLNASMNELARRAGVSKQTLYNRYPSKAEVARALAARRSDAITAPLRAGGDVETVLTAMAAALIRRVCNAEKGASLRGVALMSPEAPDLARAIYDAGPGESLRRIAAWLADQDRAGRLAVPDPQHAAEMFSGMVLGHGHLRSLLAVPHPDADIEARARETARRFIRAFAPEG
ncbi:MAG: TetR/AcrR family transcriptional regulator [Brevundimonas sp.]|uniref:TetR/AcrR family transcriptional regulator n=1 Tax=Brevundimonas sp. TaxID=1871086 RepID=UPI0025BDEACF|nr:TetR/AcrR family transcriptional regulator [Brevundimonas sp.]MBX3478139.1 TetR/AcrR family transcriptional regulator [Brevundimonas sp.]